MKALTDKECILAIRNYAVWAYAYEIHNVSLVSDGEYDQLCVWLRDNYAAVKPYDINGYLDEEELITGTGSSVAYRLSGQTKQDAANRIARSGQAQ